MQKRKEKSFGEIEEQLDTVGQESETKAVKWVQELGKQQRKEESERKAISRDKVEHIRKKSGIFTYRDTILSYMKSQMVEAYDYLPVNFLWYPVKDHKQGIQLWIRCSRNRWFFRGMHICMVPAYDMQCVDKLIEKALNHMDDLEETYLQEKKLEQPEIIT